MSKISVLHVDDEEAFLEISSRFLKKIGSFDITTALSADAALKMMSEKQFEVVISDYQMPGIDGIEFLKLLNSQGSEIPFILFTGKGREDVAIEALNNGATYYLQKGRDLHSQFHELAHMINQAAISARSRAQLAESQDRFRRLADGISDYFVGLDTDLRVTYWNKAVVDSTGKKTADAVGLPLFEAIPQLVESGLEQKLMHALKKSSKEEFTIEIEGSEGSMRLEVTAYPTEDGLSLFARDATERLLTEQRLAESELRYGALVKHSPHAIIVFVDARIVYANPSALRIYRAETPEDLVGKSIYDIIPPEQVAETKERVKRILRDGTVAPPRETKLLRRDGSMIEMEVVSSPVAYGGRQAIQTMLRDITERKTTEKKIWRHTEELRMILDSVPAIIAYQDRDGRFVRVNRSFADAISLPEDGWRDKTPGEVFDQQYAEAWKIDPELLEDGRPRLGAVSPYRFQDGSIRWIKTDRIPYRGEDGRIEGVITIADDISDLLRSEREVALQKQLLEKIRDAVLITDTQYVIQVWGGGAEAMYGWSSDEVVGKSAQDVLQSDFVGKDRGAVLEELSNTGNVEARVRQLRKDGTWIDVDCTAVALHDEQGSVVGYASVNRDITERARYEKALEAANRRLRLLGSVTRHDSLNQLSLLKGWLEMAAESEQDEEVRGFLHRALSAASKLRDQLEFTAQYKDLGARDPGWVSLDEVVLRQKRDIEPRGVSLECDGCEFLIYADPMLENVFANLVENSVVHGGVSEISVSTIQDDRGLTVAYEDDGCGVPEDQKERIFEAGYGKGSGFGLYLSREILSITGMTITESGTPGKGARFEIRIPQGVYRPK